MRILVFVTVGVLEDVVAHGEAGELANVTNLLAIIAKQRLGLACAHTLDCAVLCGYSV